MRLIALFILILLSNLNHAQSINKQDSCAMIPKLIPIKINKKWGYSNAQKEIIIKPIFEEAEPYYSLMYYKKIKSQESDFATVKYKGNYYRIDTLGKRIDKIDITKSETADIAFMAKAPNFEFVNNSGKFGIRKISTQTDIIKPEYDDIIPFDNYRIFNFPYIVKLKDKYGVIDQNGKLIVPIIYDEISYSWLYWYQVGLLLVKKNDTKYFVDLCGNEYLNK